MSIKIGPVADRPAVGRKRHQWIDPDTNRSWISDGVDWIELSNVAAVGGGGNVLVRSGVANDVGIANNDPHTIIGNGFGSYIMRADVNVEANYSLFLLEAGDEIDLRARIVTSNSGSPGAGLNIEVVPATVDPGNGLTLGAPIAAAFVNPQAINTVYEDDVQETVAASGIYIVTFRYNANPNNVVAGYSYSLQKTA